jgi:ArsR family transcriptional regulator
VSAASPPPARGPVLDEAGVVAALGALAQAMRLRAFRALVAAGPRGLTPGALSEALDVPASTLSFHLGELARSALVTQERDGRHLIYRPSLARMDALLGYLTDQCCGGQPCELAPRGGLGAADATRGRASAAPLTPGQVTDVAADGAGAVRRPDAGRGPPIRRPPDLPIL